MRRPNRFSGIMAKATASALTAVTMGAGFATVAAVVSTQPAGATVLTSGPSAIEGNLVIHVGDFITAGYFFLEPGQQPNNTKLSMASAKVSLPVSCTMGGPAAGVIVVNLASGPAGAAGPDYTVSTGDITPHPSLTRNDPAAFQGVTAAPNLCAGNPMFSGSNSPPSGGATFSVDAQSTDTVDPIVVAFHYRDPAARNMGNIDCTHPPAVVNPNACMAGWSAASHVTPSALPSVGKCPPKPPKPPKPHADRDTKGVDSGSAADNENGQHGDKDHPGPCSHKHHHQLGHDHDGHQDHAGRDR